MPHMYAGKVNEFRDNLTSLYAHATAEDITNGLAWYPRAHAIVLEWADTYSYSIATVACVIAAISPQTNWDRNLIIANDVLAGRPASIGGAIRSNIVKAERIRADRAGQIIPYFPFGPKVASFAANLAGDYSMVTVDTHGTQAAVNDINATIRLTWPRYATFADAYQRAARSVNVAPADFQAVIWCVWKRIHPTAEKKQRRRMWCQIGEF